MTPHTPADVPRSGRLRPSAAPGAASTATVWWLVCATTLGAQTRASDAPPPETTAPVTDFAAVQRSKVYRAARITGAIQLDGRFDEAAWESAQVGSGFYQTDPESGDPATEATTFRVVYDENNIYVAVTAQQRDPVIISELKREFATTDGDEIVLFFDTFHDGRNGFAFHTNPGAAMRDQQIAAGTPNENWDGVFDVATEVTGEGWTAEFEIPFRTLRFDDSGAAEAWGFNVQRIMRGKNEWVQWSPSPRPFRIFEASTAGTLEGLEGVRQGRNLKVKPFTVGSLEGDNEDVLPGGNDLDVGLDLKYGVTSRLTLDLTVNTDFSQVEADAQQVNLTRFSLFFPEKRDFFLENLGLFDVCGNVPEDGRGGRLRGRCGIERDIVPFFSRRIGLSDSGQPLPIRGGARLTGKVGGLDVGLLSMFVGDQDEIAGSNWTVGRVRQDILSNSQIGGFALNRRSDGDDWNRSVGVDGNFNFFRQRLNVTGFTMITDTPGEDAENMAGALQLNYQDRLLSGSMGLVFIGDDFDNDFGFVPRRGVRKYLSNTGITPRFGSGPVLEINPRVILRHTFDTSNERVSKFDAVGNITTFRDGARLVVFRNLNFERLDDPFLIQGVTIPAGEYSFEDWHIRYVSSAARRLSLQGLLRTGEFYSGTKREVEVGATLRYGAALQTSVIWGHNVVTLPTGGFTTDLVSARADLAVSPRMFLQSFIQYNTAAKTLSSNIRYRFIHHPLSDLFLVYNEVRGIEGNDQTYRVLSLKLTHLLSF